MHDISTLTERAITLSLSKTGTRAIRKQFPPLSLASYQKIVEGDSASTYLRSSIRTHTHIILSPSLSLFLALAVAPAAVAAAASAAAAGGYTRRIYTGAFVRVTPLPARQPLSPLSPRTYIYTHTMLAARSLSLPPL